MKKILLIISTLFLIGCDPLSKIELPLSNDNPPMITYTKVEESSTSKEKNYNNLVGEIYKLSPDAKMKLGLIGDVESEKFTYLQITMYSFYTYKEKDWKFSFLLTCEISDSGVKMTINQIHIFDIYHTKLERLYFSEKRRWIKKYNPQFESIDSKINWTLHNLCQIIE